MSLPIYYDQDCSFVEFQSFILYAAVFASVNLSENISCVIYCLKLILMVNSNVQAKKMVVSTVIGR